MSYQPSDPSQTPPTPAQVQPPVADPAQLPVAQPPAYEQGQLAQPPPYEPAPMAPPPPYEPAPMAPPPYQPGGYQPGSYQPGAYQPGPYQSPPTEQQPGPFQPYQGYQPAPGPQPPAYQSGPYQPPNVYQHVAVSVNPGLYAGPMPRDKTVAVLLAVFLSFWTWVYTYRRDAALFWINLVLSIVTVGTWGVFVAWPWAIILAAVRPSTFYANYPYG